MTNLFIDNKSFWWHERKCPLNPNGRRETGLLLSEALCFSPTPTPYLNLNLARSTSIKASVCVGLSVSDLLYSVLTWSCWIHFVFVSCRVSAHVSRVQKLIKKGFMINIIFQIYPVLGFIYLWGEPNFYAGWGHFWVGTENSWKSCGREPTLTLCNWGILE